MSSLAGGRDRGMFRIDNPALMKRFAARVAKSRGLSIVAATFRTAHTIAALAARNLIRKSLNLLEVGGGQAADLWTALGTDYHSL
jgi:hypothetical protein